MTGTLTAAEDAGAPFDRSEGPTIRAAGRTVPSWLIMALPAAGTICLALPGLKTRQLWRDELSTRFISGYPLHELYGYVKQTDVVNAPYYLFMHFWMNLFGDSEIALRMPSVLGFAAAATFTAVIGRRLYNPTVGVTAGFVLAVLPNITRYAQEARGFALGAAVATLSFLLLLRAVERPDWTRWAWYALAVAVVGNLHLVALLVLPAHGAYVAMSWFRSRDRRLSRWLAACVVASIALLPLLWMGQQQRGQVSWIPAATFGITVDMFVDMTGATRVSVILLGIAFLGVWPLGRRSATLVLWAAGPFVALYLASPHVNLLLERYMTFTLPAICLLVGIAVHRYVATFGEGTALVWQRRAVPAFVVLLTCATGLQAAAQSYLVDNIPEPDMRGAAQVIATSYHAGDSIGYQGEGSFMWDRAINYYLPPDLRLPTRFTATTGVLTVDTCAPGQSCAPGGRLWLVNTVSPSDPLSGVGTSFRTGLEQQYTATKTVDLHLMTITLYVPRP
jgi:mannosyltransferase